MLQSVLFLFAVCSLVSTIAANDFSVETRAGHGATKTTEAELTNVELLIRKEFRDSTSGAVEAIGFLVGWSNIHEPRRGGRVAGAVIVRFGDRIELRRYLMDHDRRYYVRSLSAERLAAVRRRLATLSPTTLRGTPAAIKSEDGGILQATGMNGRLFFHFKSQAGTRVRFDVGVGMSTATRDEFARYRAIERLFDSLAYKEADWEVRYDLPRPIDGFKILYGDPAEAVVNVWMERDRLVCALSKRRPGVEALEAGRKVEGWYIRDGKKDGEATVPLEQREVPFRIEVAGHVLRPFRESSDGKWVVGFCKKTDQLMCFDRQAAAWKELPLELSHGRWLPLYYCAERRLFLLGRFDPAGLDSVTWRMARAGNLVTSQVRTFSPSGAQPVKGIANDDPQFLERVAHYGGYWTQQLPLRLQRRTGADHVVWLANAGMWGVSVFPFDLRKWTPLYDRHLVVPGFPLGISQIFVDEQNKRILAAYKGDLLEFPFLEPSDGF